MLAAVALIVLADDVACEHRALVDLARGDVLAGAARDRYGHAARRARLMLRRRDLLSRRRTVDAGTRLAAAVCFRWSEGRPEFLLVRTSDGARWTFPKGRHERGETLAQSAAREAWEEAGVRGAVDDQPLGQYRHAPSRRPGRADDPVAAFLLEVSTADGRGEHGRDPTWFGAHHARERLAEHRDRLHANELSRVLGAAERELRDTGRTPR